jgi:excinuclease UvrABC nuclease subunit
VYTWLGRDGEKLYIGKSRSLRDRMLSYLHPVNLRHDSRQRHLVQALEGFEWRETAGELLALLLEDALIKECNPRYNERQKDYRERAYVLLTDDPFPTLLAVEQPDRRPGSLYGPFKDVYFARDLAALITDALALRACPDAEPWRRSVRFDLGQCPGPCREEISRDAYAERVRGARAFLNGDPSALQAALSEQMADASERLRFEEAASLRDSLEFAARFAVRQRFFREFEAECFVVQEPSTALVYTFSRGSLARVEAAAGHALAIPDELARRVVDRRFLLDRANVVYAWMPQTVSSATAEPGPAPDAVRFRMP